MSHIDTLKTFEDFKTAGVPEIQARAQVKALDEAFDGLDSVRKAELDYSIAGVLNSIELLRKEFTGLRWLVIAIGGICAVPIIQKLFF